MLVEVSCSTGEKGDGEGMEEQTRKSCCLSPLTFWKRRLGGGREREGRLSKRLRYFFVLKKKVKFTFLRKFLLLDKRTRDMKGERKRKRDVTGVSYATVQLGESREMAQNFTLWLSFPFSYLKKL